MFDKASLQELIDYAGQNPVLSVYLQTDMLENRTEAVKLALKNLLKRVDAPADVEAITRYVTLEWDWEGRGLAIFSSQQDGFFRAWSLALPMPNYAVLSARPYVKPLANLLDNYGYYGVALVDKQGARLFFFHLGELVEQSGAFWEEVHQRRGGVSGFSSREREGGSQEHTREVVTRNLKESAEFAARFFAEKHVRKVVLAGTDENIAEFRGLLPKRWQSLVVGTVNVNMSAAAEDLRTRALALCTEFEARQESQRVQRMLTLAAKGREGVVGLDDTLSAAHEGRIQTLLVQEGYAAEGWKCAGCGYLTTQPVQTCPFCGEAFVRIPDAVEAAVRKVLQDGGEVDVVRHVPKMQEIGIGGLLRY